MAVKSAHLRIGRSTQIASGLLRNILLHEKAFFVSSYENQIKQPPECL